PITAIFRLTASAEGHAPASTRLATLHSSGLHVAAVTQVGAARPKLIARRAIPCPGDLQEPRKPGCRVAFKGRHPMQTELTHVLAPVAGAGELDRLGDEIAELSAHLDAATARLLALIREFDARGGWNTGFRSCAHWLSWRVGLDPGAARERVRVARALGTLPLLGQALGRGELSYAKVRALTRVATPETEARLLAVGRAGTAAHVERIVRGWRRGDRKAEAREAKQRHISPGLHIRHDRHDLDLVT